MKAVIKCSRARRSRLAYTLIELLCSVAIIGLLAAMALPALDKGYEKGKRLYCVNNLHQTGLAFLSFAHSHHDRFPMQVSTNDGGSFEFLRAASMMRGEFYFSYRHFATLSNELMVPKVLRCPTDTRRPASDFAALENENLSYFVAASPEFGSPNTPLAGDRNVAPVYGSIAKVGGYRCLTWTEELHRFKGNVLYGDGHVDQLNGIFSSTNSGLASVGDLHLPTVKPVPEDTSGRGPAHEPDGAHPRGRAGLMPFRGDGDPGISEVSSK